MLAGTAFATDRPAKDTQAEDSPPVPVCDALTLYGSAVNSGLCKRLSTSELWVCELTQNNPDIHMTFNKEFGLHLTVRLPKRSCEGKSELTGNWNERDGHTLKLAKGQLPKACEVNLQNYAARLNATTRLNGAGGYSACMTAFQTARSRDRISGQEESFYIDLCKQNNCP
ncbi:hypothetical protein AC629_10215 [Bradyrhizobium sp. NAS80.1]|nr:hypothetical protein AC630_34635 [Bradyrhizobium sp. AS23.2]OKO88297.1 hypothetical protein AC629_10215 [Bradyrhizobium sp. NAS80.1]